MSAERLLVDAEFERAAEAAGLDPEELFTQPEPEASGYNVAIIYDGAFDAEAMVFASFNEAQQLAEAIVEREQDEQLEVTITHTAVGPEYIEATGYGPYGRVRWTSDGIEVS